MGAPGGGADVRDTRTGPVSGDGSGAFVIEDGMRITLGAAVGVCTRCPGVGEPVRGTPAGGVIGEPLRATPADGIGEPLRGTPAGGVIVEPLRATPADGVIVDPTRATPAGGP